MRVTGCAYVTGCEFDSAISTYYYTIQNYMSTYIEKYLNKCANVSGGTLPCRTYAAKIS